MKRPCPWEVEHQPMLKMHHSEKDETVKTGAMETVYSKTLAMLFNGANKKNNNQPGSSRYTFYSIKYETKYMYIKVQD